MFIINLLVLSALFQHSYQQNCEELQGFLRELKQFRTLMVHRALEADNCLHLLAKTHPTILLNNTTNVLGSELDIFLVFSLKSGSWLTGLDYLDKSRLWTRRHKTLFIGNFSLENVKENSIIALRRLWAINLAFIDFGNFSNVMRFNPFSGKMLTGSSLEIICKDISGNLYGYELKIAMFENIIAKWNGESFEGRDGLSLTEMIKKLNATPKYIFHAEGDYGDIINGTPTGILKTIMERRVDLSFNIRFIMLNYTKLIDFTKTVELSFAVIVLPIQSAKANILNIIPPSILLLGILLLLIFSIYVKKCGKKPTWNNILLLNMQLLTSRTVNLLNIKYYKLVLITLIIYFFFVDNLFQARLVSVLTKPTEVPRLTKIKQVAESHIRFNTDVILRFSLDTMEGIYKEETQQILKRNKYFYDNKKYLERIFQCYPNEGFLSLISLAKDYIGRTLDSQGYRKRCYYFLEETLFFIHNSFILTQGSPLLSRVDQHMDRLHSSGLFALWERNQRPVSIEANSNEPKKIQLRNVLFCFYILVGGWVLGFLVFLHEVGLY